MYYMNEVVILQKEKSLFNASIQNISFQTKIKPNALCATEDTVLNLGSSPK